MPVNPLIQHGHVVWKGKDPRRGYCYYTYNKLREHQEKRAIVFPDMVESLQKLGFEILPHWTNHGNVVGWYSAIGLQHHGPFKSVDSVEVGPLIQRILNNEVHNASFKNLLSFDKE